MTPEDVLDLFRSSNALLKGHFLLSSGLHSDRYLQCALVLQHPATASALGQALAERLLRIASRVECVVAPALGGILVAHEVARAMNLRGFFAERQEGNLTLRRGFQINPGERCVVVEDVWTTGRSTLETVELIRHHQGDVVACGSLIDRSGESLVLGVPQISLASLEVPTYAPENCPQCRAGTKAEKPGSR